MTTRIVSVLMPVYNAAKFLREALESVLAQTHRELELIAIDDASSDASSELLQEYAQRDARVRVFRQPHNQGIVAARNRAFREASAQAVYFAILDADDVCEPDRILSACKACDHHECDHTVPELVAGFRANPSPS